MRDVFGILEELLKVKIGFLNSKIMSLTAMVKFASSLLTIFKSFLSLSPPPSVAFSPFMIISSSLAAFVVSSQVAVLAMGRRH